MIRRQLIASTEALGPREIKVIAATDQVARDNAIIVPAGIDLTNYRKNPVVLAFHDPSEPIGIASDVSVQTGKLRATLTFAPEGVSATADRICQLCKTGVLSGISIGFDVKEMEPVDPGNRRGPWRYTRSELLEISVVSIPADTGAAVVQRSAGSGRGSGSEMRSAVREASAHIEAAMDHTRSALRAKRRAADSLRSFGADDDRVDCENCEGDECEGCDDAERAGAADLKRRQAKSERLARSSPARVRTRLPYRGRQIVAKNLAHPRELRRAEAAALFPNVELRRAELESLTLPPQSAAEFCTRTREQDERERQRRINAYRAGPRPLTPDEQTADRQRRQADLARLRNG